MGYRVARVDANQNDIVKKFRDLGAVVFVTSSIGHGFTDLVVGIKLTGCRLWIGLIEIKDGNKPPSKQKLTKDEQRFHDEWAGAVYIIKSTAEAQELYEMVKYYDGI
jgi:hypothetical protein